MKEKRELRQQGIEGSSCFYGSRDFIFILVYGILLSILFLTSVSEQDEFRSYIPWEQVKSIDIISLANAIAFSFLLPGYGLVVLLDKNRRLTLPNKLLLAYLISIIFVALPSYVGASLGYPIADVELFVISLYAVIFILFLLRQPKITSAGFYYLWTTLNRKSLSRVYRELKNRIPEFAVFTSLFALVVFYTYYLNDNHIVVDQWFHHGRALLIGSDVFKKIASAEFYEDPYTDFGSDITQIYPPIFSSLLAGFFSLSNSASVNAYVSIGFLNAMPIFGFCYFFTTWVPQNMKRAALLATTLFVLSSGFGWIYAVNLAIISPPSYVIQPGTSIDILANVTTTAYDIGLPTTFINVGHPDITSPLIIIALPAGFTLLGMMKEFIVKKGVGEGPSTINKDRTQKATVSRQRLNLLILKKLTGTTMRTSMLITLVSFLGILSHDEFYLFVIIACVTIVALLAIASDNRSREEPKTSFRNTLVHGYSMFFVSFLISMFLVVMIDTFISPAKYYITREIVGFPLISLCFIFVSFSWLTYIATYVTSRNRNILHVKSSAARSNNDNTKPRVHTGALRRSFDYAVSKMKENSGSIKIKNLLSVSNSPSDVSSGSSIANFRVYRTIRVALPVFTVSVVVFFYLFTFLVWSQLSYEDIRYQIDTENEWNVPWYLYPMKFGLTGLLGLVFLLSYLFKKFEKEIFVFAIVAVIALLAGPYYDEHRFGKYIMVGMASFAAILIYKIISKSFSHSSFIPLNFASRLKCSIHLGSKFNVVAGGILLGLVVTSSGLSIFAFAGFVELVTSVADYNEGTRRDFPTPSEMQLVDFLHAKFNAQNPDEYYNIALPDKEVDNNRGFLTKIYGFTPIPRAKLLQTPLVLNASTIETFYNLLDYSGTKFIVLPKKDLSGNISAISNIYPASNIIHFALENFRKVFENDNYVAFEVPSLSPPSPKGDVAFVYPGNESLKKEQTYFQHFYPLNMLALSKIEYNTYIEGDLSAFSKKYVIVPFDPFDNDSNQSLSSPAGSNYTREVDSSIYFDYVRNGGKLIVIDSANYGKEKSQGVLSRLLSISPTGNYARFDSLSDANSLQSTINVTSKKNTTEPVQKAQEIERNYTSIMNISGVVERTLLDSGKTTDSSINVTSYYTKANNNNEEIENTAVAPFTIEKKYGNGKITYINARGYFHAIFSDLSSNNSNNNNTYQGNNKGHYFLSLANLTNFIDPNLAKENRQFPNEVFLIAASHAESTGAPTIRQIIDNIQISSGYQTRVNSSSLLLPISTNSTGDLAAQEVAFTSYSSRSAPSSVANLSNENVTAYDLRDTDTVDRSLQSSDESDQISNYEFKNAIIRNLKIYGSYEVIVESNEGSKLRLPAFPSFSDYVGVNLPDGFDMTIKLSDTKPSYAEFEVIEDDDEGPALVNSTFQRLRIYGDDATSRGHGLANVKSNEIHFLKMRSDPANNGYTSLLIKSPQFQIKGEGGADDGIQRDDVEDGLQENANTFLTFKRGSPEAEPIEIKDEAGNKERVIFRIDYVDSYSEPSPEGIKNHFLTYIEEDIKVVEDNIDNVASKNSRGTDYQYSTDMPAIKLPADISDRAKKLGMDVQWQKTMTSGNGLLLVILVTATSITAAKIGTKMSSRSKLKFS